MPAPGLAMSCPGCTPGLGTQASGPEPLLESSFMSRLQGWEEKQQLSLAAVAIIAVPAHNFPSGVCPLQP